MAAEDIGTGRLLRTLDAGLQPVAWYGQRRLAGRGAAAPVLFAPGTIGNHAPLRLSQQHRVLLRSPLAELMFGTAEVLVPARALVNGTSIRIAPCARITYVHVLLEAHHILRAEGALCESLLMGDEAMRLLQAPRCAGRAAMRPARPILRGFEAAALVRAPPAKTAPRPPRAAPVTRIPACAAL